MIDALWFSFSYNQHNLILTLRSCPIFIFSQQFLKTSSKLTSMHVVFKITEDPSENYRLDRWLDSLLVFFLYTDLPGLYKTEKWLCYFYRAVPNNRQPGDTPQTTSKLLLLWHRWWRLKHAERAYFLWISWVPSYTTKLISS